MKRTTSAFQRPDSRSRRRPRSGGKVAGGVEEGLDGVQHPAEVDEGVAAGAGGRRAEEGQREVAEGAEREPASLEGGLGGGGAREDAPDEADGGQDGQNGLEDAAMCLGGRGRADGDGAGRRRGLHGQGGPRHRGARRNAGDGGGRRR